MELSKPRKAANLRVLSSVLGAWLALASVAAPVDADDSNRLGLTRTIYVPVEFEVDQPLLDRLHIWIEQEDGNMSLSPRPHTFMFTYFPEHGVRAFKPEQIEVRIQADATPSCTGVDTNFVVTPLGIVTAERVMAFDQEKMMKQVRSRKRDLRVPKKVVKVRCSEGTDAARTRRAQPES